jgi:hypothetical protein
LFVSNLGPLKRATSLILGLWSTTAVYHAVGPVSAVPEEEEG